MTLTNHPYQFKEIGLTSSSTLQSLKQEIILRSTE